MPFLIRLIFAFIKAIFKSKASLTLELLAKDQQLATYNQNQPRPQLKNSDRLYRIIMKIIWLDWKNHVKIITPETVISWRRKGFKKYWAWKSKVYSRKRGRPPITQEVKDLIYKLSKENPGWSAKRIRDELKHLDIKVSKNTVRKYRFHQPTTPK